MNEFTAVTSDGMMTTARDSLPGAGPASGEAVTADLSVTHSDGPGEHVVAVLRGGPAAGKQVRVPRIAGTFPLFLGVDGGNYVHDKGSGERPVYNWWPAGANSPAGDPTARSKTR